VNYGLDPRTLPPLVFDHLQYANIEGKGQGDLVTSGDITEGIDTQKVVVAVINNVPFTMTCPQHPDQ